MTDLQKKMATLRSKLPDADEDASLTFQGILLYDEMIKDNVQSVEQRSLTHSINAHLIN